MTRAFFNMPLLNSITLIVIAVISLSLNSSIAAPKNNTSILPPAIHYSSSIGNLPKWERIVEFYDMANLQNPSYEYREWWDFIRSIKDAHPKEQIEQVNTWLNKRPYKQDNWIYNRDDHWATPSEFLKNGGDCEDYAIIKYMTLRRLGFRADQMKVAMVYDIYSGTDHSYLVVDYGKRNFILDSRDENTDPAQYLKRYRPHYAFNETGIWTFKSPKIVLKNRQSSKVLPSNR